MKHRAKYQNPEEKGLKNEFDKIEMKNFMNGHNIHNEFVSLNKYSQKLFKVAQTNFQKIQKYLKGTTEQEFEIAPLDIWKKTKKKKEESYNKLVKPRLIKLANETQNYLKKINNLYAKLEKGMQQMISV